MHYWQDGTAERRNECLHYVVAWEGNNNLPMRTYFRFVHGICMYPSHHITQLGLLIVWIYFAPEVSGRRYATGDRTLSVGNDW